MDYTLKTESVYSTPFCPNTHTVHGLVCVLGQFSVQYTLSFYSVENYYASIFPTECVDQLEGGN